MNRAVALLRKEWEDVFRNRMVLFTLFLTPLLLSGVAMVSTLSTVKTLPSSNQGDMAELARIAGPLCADVRPDECPHVYIASLMMVLFLVLPTALPSVIAAYSVVGEKTERTLEPLLATPISVVELLMAKAIGATVPAVLASWMAAGAYYAFIAVVVSPSVAGAVLSGAWWGTLGLGVPLLALASVLVAMMVSSRATDPRSAQQIAGLVVLPFVAIVVAQAFGVMVMRPWIVWPALGGLALFDAALGWATLRLFHRETILTRWTGV